MKLFKIEIKGSFVRFLLKAPTRARLILLQNKKANGVTRNSQKASKVQTRHTFANLLPPTSIFSATQQMQCTLKIILRTHTTACVDERGAALRDYARPELGWQRRHDSLVSSIGLSHPGCVVWWKVEVLL